MPATCVPCGSFASKALRPAAPEPGPGNVLATITFGVVIVVSPFGNPAGYEKPVGSRYGLVASTPVSTTPILIPWPDVAGRGGVVGRVDHGRPAVDRREVGDARIDLRGEVEADELRQQTVRQLDREAVEDDAVALLHARLRDRDAELGDGRLLGACQLGEVRLCRRGVDVQPVGV